MDAFECQRYIFLSNDAESMAIAIELCVCSLLGICRAQLCNQIDKSADY